MIYNVLTFDRLGLPLREHAITAKNPLAAANAARGFLAAHARVKGQTVKRFSYVGFEVTLIDSAPTIHRVYAKEKPALLLMFDRIPEFVVYSYNDNRNKAYMVCTRLASAEFAKPSPEQTDTIVYSGAMFGSKSGSTLKRTLSGSATSVTCSDLLTPSSTDDYFGSDKSSVSGLSKWNLGSTRSPSKLPKKIFAKVNLRFADPDTWPGLNSHMLRKHGKVLLLRKKVVGSKELYRGGPWYYLPKWLETRNIKLKVSPQAPQPYERLYNKVFTFSKCDCGCDAYYTGDKYDYDNHYVDMQWLSVPERSEID